MDHRNCPVPSQVTWELGAGGAMDDFRENILENDFEEKQFCKGNTWGKNPTEKKREKNPTKVISYQCIEICLASSVHLCKSK